MKLKKYIRKEIMHVAVFSEKELNMPVRGIISIEIGIRPIFNVQKHEQYVSKNPVKSLAEELSTAGTVDETL